MEGNLLIKKCDFCEGDANSLCIKCMLYFCDSCFQLAHKSEGKKTHSKEKIDYFCPIDTKCQFHNIYPNGLFCLDEKSNLNIIFYFYYSIMLSFMCF